MLNAQQNAQNGYLNNSNYANASLGAKAEPMLPEMDGIGLSLRCLLAITVDRRLQMEAIAARLLGAVPTSSKETSKSPSGDGVVGELRDIIVELQVEGARMEAAIQRLSRL